MWKAQDGDVRAKTEEIVIPWESSFRRFSVGILDLNAEYDLTDRFIDIRFDIIFESDTK